ncbi:MAG TPA: hypothetical protein VFZ93_14565 [Albitalea sp.]
MSNPIITLQVAPQREAPRGALWLGALAAAVWTTVRDLARPLFGAPADPAVPYRESRHA